MKKGLCILLCVMLAMTCSGCWSREEPKVLGIVDSILYDINDDGTIKLTVELLNPSGLQSAGGGGAGLRKPTITITGEGKTVREAIASLAMTRENLDFGAHNKVRFLSEKFASRDLTDFLDMTGRGYLTDERPLMIVVKGGNPENIYNSMIGTSDEVGEYLNLMKSYQPKSNADGVFETSLNFIDDYYTEGREPVAGVVELAQSTDKPSGNNGIGTQSGSSSGSNYEIKYKGLAVFKGSSMVGYMDGTEAMAYNFLTDKIVSPIVSVPSEGGDYTAVMVVKSSAGVKTYMDGDKVGIDVSIKAVLNVEQAGKETDITDPDAAKTVEKRFDALMEEEISEAIKKAQTEFASDIFGFGQDMHIQHPDKWRDIKDNWNDDYFANAAVNVTVDSSIALMGKIEKPFNMEGAIK